MHPKGTKNKAHKTTTKITLHIETLFIVIALYENHISATVIGQALFIGQPASLLFRG